MLLSLAGPGPALRSGITTPLSIMPVVSDVSLPSTGTPYFCDDEPPY